MNEPPAACVQRRMSHRTHKVFVTSRPSAETVKRVQTMLAIAAVTVAGQVATVRRQYVPEEVTRAARGIEDRLLAVLTEARATTEVEARMVAEAVRLADGTAVVEYDPDISDDAVTVQRVAPVSA